MKLTHIYRIKPSTEQVAIMDTWLEMLRRHFNYALGQRFDWLRRTRCQIDKCSLVSEPIGDIPDLFPGYNFQAGELKTTKELFPAYKEIHAEVQQQNLKRLDKTWDRWIKPDNSGKRAGRPKFKKKGEMRSFTFPRIKGLAKTRLAKSIYDVAWGKFLTILEAVALRSGVHFVKVSPDNTTVNCSRCGTKVPKTLSVRLHECSKCNLEMDRDENAAINVLYKALTAVGLTVAAFGRLSGSTPDDTGMPNCEVGKLSLYS